MIVQYVSKAFDKFYDNVKLAGVDINETVYDVVREQLELLGKNLENNIDDRYNEGWDDNYDDGVEETSKNV